MKFVRLMAGCLLLGLSACATQSDPLSDTRSTVSVDKEALAAEKKKTTRVEPPRPHETREATEKSKLAEHTSGNPPPALTTAVEPPLEAVASVNIGSIDHWQNNWQMTEVSTEEVHSGVVPTIPPGIKIVDAPYVPPAVPTAVSPATIDLGAYDIAIAPIYGLADVPQSTTALEIVPQQAAPRSMQPVYEAEDFAPPRPSLRNLIARGLGFGARLEDQWTPTHQHVPSVTQHHYDANFARELALAAKGRTHDEVRYDGRYVEIGYPWGDVPANMGVCTDVIVRSYRALGIDLQQLVHEDMKRAFWAYPSQRIYGLDEPDSNIDHRRVVNLEVFFKRHGQNLPITMEPGNYLPGDLVTWRISGKQPHIGIVIDQRDDFSKNRLVVHNIGAGPEAGDILFVDEPVGHFRFTPSQETRLAQR